AQAAIAAKVVVFMAHKPTPAVVAAAYRSGTVIPSAARDDNATERRMGRRPRSLPKKRGSRAYGIGPMAPSPATAHHRTTVFTTIAHYTDPIEAHLARGRLQSEGIDAHLGDEHLAMANWEWRLAVGGVKLRVADRDAGRARAVLAAMDAGEYALEADTEEARALLPPDRESWSSRLA